MIDVALPMAGEPESLSYSRSLVIDTTSPYVVNVTSTQSNGTFTVGSIIGVLIRFNFPVVVVNARVYPNCTFIDNGVGESISGFMNEEGPGTAAADDNVAVGACEGLPVLLLDISGNNGNKNASYAGGNGTTTLLFRYQV